MVAGDDSSGHPLGDRRLVNTVPLESDLAARSTAALKGTVLDKTQITVDGRDVTLRADASRKMAVAARSPRSRPCPACGWSTTKPAWSPKPGRSSGRRNATWSGSRLAAVRHCRPPRASCWRRRAPSLGNVEVADQMNLSRGAPPRFDAAALLLIDQIAKLKDGKITISDDKVSLSGMARDLGGREAIAAALEKPARGIFGRGQRRSRRRLMSSRPTRIRSR